MRSATFFKFNIRPRDYAKTPSLVVSDLAGGAAEEIKPSPHDLNAILW
jgi:hypothetical protein